MSTRAPRAALPPFPLPVPLPFLLPQGKTSLTPRCSGCRPPGAPSSPPGLRQRSPRARLLSQRRCRFRDEDLVFRFQIGVESVPGWTGCAEEPPPGLWQQVAQHRPARPPPDTRALARVHPERGEGGRAERESGEPSGALWGPHGARHTHRRPSCLAVTVTAGLWVQTFNSLTFPRNSQTQRRDPPHLASAIPAGGCCCDDFFFFFF